MSDQIVERELHSFIYLLQQKGMHEEAFFLGRNINFAKGNLTFLVKLRDYWADRLEVEQ